MGAAVFPSLRAVQSGSQHRRAFSGKAISTCLEDEFNTNKDASGVDFSVHCQMMFSETWIVGCYEILRVFQQLDREAAKAGTPTSGVSELHEFKSIFTDFELLRMPIAKFEIAKDPKPGQPLPMRRAGDDETKPIEFYDPKDPGRFHIMPKGVSSRGSAVWLALDVRNSRQHRAERRDLADRLLSLLKLVRGAGELEVQQNAVAQNRRSSSSTSGSPSTTAGRNSTGSRLARDVRAGRYEPRIEKQEADLHMNPRRVRSGHRAPAVPGQRAGTAKETSATARSEAMRDLPD